MNVKTENRDEMRRFKIIKKYVEEDDAFNKDEKKRLLIDLDYLDKVDTGEIEYSFRREETVNWEIYYLLKKGFKIIDEEFQTIVLKYDGDDTFEYIIIYYYMGERLYRRGYKELKATAHEEKRKYDMSVKFCFIEDDIVAEIEKNGVGALYNKK